MKIKHPVLIGLIVIIVPLLVGQVMSTKRTSVVKPVEAKKSIPKRAPNPPLEKLLKEYETQISALALEAKTPGAAIAVVYNNDIVYLKSFGIKRAGKDDPVDVNTVFRIASVSKCFASFLTGILVEDTILNWNDPISNYLPTFALQSQAETDKLTIRNVLSHTTGLPYHAYTNMVEEGIPLDSMLSWLKKIHLVSGVGQSYSYQNVAYSIIGEVIRVKTGKTYEEEMREQVFKPLQMKTASIDYASISTNDNIAYPHKMRKGKWIPATITNTYYNVAPAGGVNASISDMAQWMIALLGNRPDVISQATLQTLFTPVIKAPSKNRNYGRMHRLSNSYYGLGWRVLHYPNDTIIYHGGFVNGYRSEVALNPKENIAVCILANAPGDLADNGIPLFFSLFEASRDSIVDWDVKERARLTPQPLTP
ncbi:MAG TPA: serine hydrolase domain-containing protein [Chryseolinea sp.]|nr:serine hydrolase domain-containing protein [Chryseolinea sp.]